VTTLKQALASVDLKRLDSKLLTALATAPPYSSQRNFGRERARLCYTQPDASICICTADKSCGLRRWYFDFAGVGGRACCIEQDDFTQGDIWERSVIAVRDEKLFGLWEVGYALTNNRLNARAWKTRLLLA